MIPTIVKQTLLKILAVISLLLFAAAPSWGADFDKGSTAAQNGDYVTAFNEWQSLAEQGDADAQFSLGLLYHSSDDVAAVKWYSLAAEQGLAGAQFNLGYMYHNGKGVPRDYKAAVKWYRSAVEQGIAAAQYHLGLLYHSGEGGVQDYITAHAWYSIAATNGDETAATNRNMIAKYMTAEQITAAKALADKCIKSNYKNCIP